MIASIGAELRRIRLLNSLSLKDVAEKAGVSQMYISEIERDKKKPSDELIQKLAVIYGMDERQLYESFGRVPEHMLHTLVQEEDKLFFNIIYDISMGKLKDENKKVLFEQVHDIYQNIIKDNK